MKTKKTLVLLGIMFAAVLSSAADNGQSNACQLPEPGGEGSGGSKVPQSFDPNEMAGPEGVGTNRYVRTGDWMDYTIYFENYKTASAAAIKIAVTLPKDASLDWSTLEFGEVAFGEHVDTGFVEDKAARSIAYSLAGSGCEVRTSVSESDDAVTWNLRIWDPSTSDHFPDDFMTGILPPNDDTGRGEGHLRYRVRVKDDAAAGEKIVALASIVFDDNPEIVTDPAWTNTVAEIATVSFEGGETKFDDVELIVGVPYGELPEPAARTGYVFGGWFTSVNGTGRRITAQSIVESGDGALYEHWLANAYTVKFDANGGEGLMSNQAMVFDQAKALDECAFTKEGHSFAGWATEADGDVVYEDCAEVVNLANEQGAVVELFAVWSINSYTVTFDANGGIGGWERPMTYGTEIVVPTVTREGYVFVGWIDGTGEATGQRPVVPAAIVPAGNVTYVAQWEEDVPPATNATWTVTFDANGGVGGWSREMEEGAEIVVPSVTREGYNFAGWSPATGQRPVVPAHDVTYVAQWERVWITPLGYGEDGEALLGSPALDAASVWDGWVVEKGQGSRAKGQGLRGVVQVKVGKENKKTGEAKVSASVTMLGAKKQTVKMSPISASVAKSEGVAKDGTVLSLVFGSDSLTGTYGNYDVAGALSGFVSKDKAAQADANASLARWLGPVNIAWEADYGWNTLTVTLAKKGKAKAAGTLWDGTKLSGTAQVVQGDEWSAVPVLVAKKTPMAFMMWLGADGETVELEGMADGAVAGRPGAIASGAMFGLDADAFAAALGDATFKDYLPDGVHVGKNGSKWVVAKGGKVVYKKGTTEVDEAKAGENPSGLKLTYTPKTGAFKGSFKAYTEVKGKPKGVAAKIAGVVIDGIAYGTATIKKILSLPVWIK